MGKLAEHEETVVSKMKQIVKNGKPIVVDESIKSYFWDIYEDNSWEPETFVILDRFLNTESTYVDIGAWIGPTVLYGAHQAKRTIALEPDKTAYSYLETNVELNKGLAEKITLINKAVSVDDKPVMIHTNDADSSSSLINPRGYQDNYLVEGITLQTLLGGGGAVNVDLIKVDVEGFEYYLVSSMLSGLRELNLKPTIYLSIHKPFLKAIYEAKYRKYPKPLARALVDLQVKRLTNRLIESFKDYRNIYTSNGELMQNRHDIAVMNNFDSFVATDEEW